LHALLGGVPLIAAVQRMAAVEAALKFEPDPIRRLAALNVLVFEDAERLRERLRLANTEQERLASMGQVWWRRIIPAGDRLAQPWLYRLGPQHFIDRVLLAWARAGAPADDKAWRELASLPQRWTAPIFPLKAADFLAKGLQKGPALGTALRAAEEAWIAAGFPSDAATLTRIADAAARG
jgi:poly(A) polymerase